MVKTSPESQVQHFRTHWKPRGQHSGSLQWLQIDGGPGRQNSPPCSVYRKTRLQGGSTCVCSIATDRPKLHNSTIRCRHHSPLYNAYRQVKPCRTHTYAVAVDRLENARAFVHSKLRIHILGRKHLHLCTDCTDKPCAFAMVLVQEGSRYSRALELQTALCPKRQHTCL